MNLAVEHLLDELLLEDLIHELQQLLEYPVQIKTPFTYAVVTGYSMLLPRDFNLESKEGKKLRSWGVVEHVVPRTGRREILIPDPNAEDIIQSIELLDPEKKKVQAYFVVKSSSISSMSGKFRYFAGDPNVNLYDLEFYRTPSGLKFAIFYM